MRIRTALGRLWRDTGGAAAVEFALVGLPSLGLIGAIFQIAVSIGTLRLTQ